MSLGIANLDLANRLKLIRMGGAVAVLLGSLLIVGASTITGPETTGALVARGLLFYVVTAAAYLALPFTRRGDIALVAMWLVLGVGIAPCFGGEEISASGMFADMGGVLLAAAPIYIARLRQIAQGDTRIYRRREREQEQRDAVPSQAELTA